MSRSDWIKFAKIVGLASGAFTLALLIYFAGYRIGEVSGHYDSQADSAAAQYPSDTQRIIDDCFKLPTRAATSECVGKATEASHENQRAEQDLIAQREMSDWGWWALIISGLQFLATIITLGFIKLTLDATLEAVKDTGEATNAMIESNRIAELAQRAWLAVNLNSVSPIIKESAGKITIGFSLTVKNTGNRPAIGVVDYIVLAGDETGQKSHDRFINGATQLIPVNSIAIAPGETHTFSGRKHVVDLIGIGPNGLRPDCGVPPLFIGVIYQDPQIKGVKSSVISVFVGSIFEENGPTLRNARNLQIIRTIMQ